MKHEKLSEALNEISDRHISEASESRRRTPRNTWIGAIAAILAVVILISAVYRPTVSEPSADAPAADSPAAAAPPEDAPALDGFHGTAPQLEGLELLNSQFDIYPEYPEMVKFNSADPNWGELFESHNIQYSQPKNYAAGTENFFRNSIQAILTEQTDNQVYSPLNVYMALSALAEITAGNTRAQIMDLLGNKDVESLRIQANHMWNAHYRDDGLSTSLLANSLWLDHTYGWMGYVDQPLRNNFYTYLYHGDLGSDKTNELLHEWINQHTGNLLQEQADNFNLSDNTALALVSTIYYNVQWNDAFYSDNNTQQSFHSPEGDRIVTFMNQTFSGRNYYWGDSFGAITLGLKDSSKMWLILPEEDTAPADLIENGQVLDLILGDTENYENQTSPLIRLSLPKFDVLSDTDLNQPLQALGVHDVFDDTVADFSSLLDEFQSNPALKLSQINHSARVSIDEEGVLAAAFTAADVAVAEAPTPEEEIDFTLDRPFLFVIESKDGIPVFCGIVNEP